ncbi:hypothetical protein RF11_13391 [Thelohanellus kitauei]|uniref:Uncharacterized protein n=1 Tax=Thelohanellus kitauei TaxID=669202 RepID=A0A0C2I509_THEKT|nr:hypothetical protein RF11_13391 [Thelohanellus kitauei]
MIHKTDNFIFPIASLHLASRKKLYNIVMTSISNMTIYILLVKNFYQRYHDLCEVSYVSFVTNWPLYMILASIIEIVIFTSFNLTIRSDPLRVEPFEDGYKLRNTRRNMFSQIVDRSYKIDNEIVEPTQ